MTGSRTPPSFCALFAAVAVTTLAPIATAREKPVSRATPKRVTIFSDSFEKEFPGGWERKGNVPTNASWFAGSPRHGTHSVRHAGSPVTGGKDCDAFIERVVSTVGHTDIEVSFHMGASGMDSATERVQFGWASDGVWSANQYWHEPKLMKGGDPDSDGALHPFFYALTPEANDNPKFTLWFGIRGTDATDDFGYVDDIVVTGKAAGGGRVTIFSDDFEKEFPGGWTRKGNEPANASWFTGAARRGSHSVQFTGSPSTDRRDCDTMMQKVISTAGKSNIQVSFRMGASGLAGKTETVEANWASDGVWSANKYWHQLKVFKGGDAENDGKLRTYSFSLPPEASNNPKFVLWFGVKGLKDPGQVGYVDDVVVTGE